jgi:hypothetical protein
VVAGNVSNLKDLFGCGRPFKHINQTEKEKENEKEKSKKA